VTPKASCPVLMYHRVGHPVQSRSDRFLNISARAFERQIGLLARLGYRARTFAEVSEALSRGYSVPRRTVAITFDDGYRCVAEAARPILDRYGMPATVFVVSGCVGGENAWDAPTEHPVSPLMSWDTLRALADGGWEIAGHTRTHPRLGSMDDDAALADIANGKQDIQSMLGATVRTFCYPYGHLNASTPRLVRHVGYEGACTTRSGIAHSLNDPFLQPRVKVYGESLLDFAFRLFLRRLLPEIRRRNLPDAPRPRRYA